MELLEDLRRHKNYYPTDVQDRNDFQLFFVYYHLNKDDFIIKLGEELRERFRKKEIKSGHDVFERINLLKNLGDTYYYKMNNFGKAYEVYKELVELGDTYSKLLEKSGILEMSWKPLLEGARENKNFLDPTPHYSNATNEISKEPKEMENNQNSSQKAQPVTAYQEIPIRQNISTHADNILKPITTPNKYADSSSIKFIGLFIGTIIIILFIAMVYFLQSKRKKSI